MEDLFVLILFLFLNLLSMKLFFIYIRNLLYYEDNMNIFNFIFKRKKNRMEAKEDIEVKEPIDFDIS